MTSVRTYYSSGATGDPYWYLERYNPATGAYDTLIGHAVADDSGIRTSAIVPVPAYGLISNGLYTYTYQVCVGDSDYFFGARIAYQYTNAGD